METDPSDPSDPLAPELRDAERSLESALDEACASPPVSEADTGELIRVEELLETAGDAAKRAISLRRRRRAESPPVAQSVAQALPKPVAMGDVEATASPSETHRVFVDARGVKWDVFAVHPEDWPMMHAQLRGTFSQGWLSFDSGAEKRRLSPIPDGWREMSEAQLAELSERAERAVTRRRPRGNPPSEESRGSQ
jgi:hypothetical protein